MGLTHDGGGSACIARLVKRANGRIYQAPMAQIITTTMGLPAGSRTISVPNLAPTRIL